MLLSQRAFDRSRPASRCRTGERYAALPGIILKYSAQAFRRKKYDPINGIRSWDFVELDPGFRFAIVDYDRVPKTGYWYMKQAQAPVALSFAYKDALESQLAGSSGRRRSG